MSRLDAMHDNSANKPIKPKLPNCTANISRVQPIRFDRMIILYHRYHNEYVVRDAMECRKIPFKHQNKRLLVSVHVWFWISSNPSKMTKSILLTLALLSVVLTTVHSQTCNPVMDCTGSTQCATSGGSMSCRCSYLKCKDFGTVMFHMNDR